MRKNLFQRVKIRILILINKKNIKENSQFKKEIEKRIYVHKLFRIESKDFK